MPTCRKCGKCFSSGAPEGVLCPACASEEFQLTPEQADGPVEDGRAGGAAAFGARDTADTVSAEDLARIWGDSISDDSPPEATIRFGRPAHFSTSKLTPKRRGVALPGGSEGDAPDYELLALLGEGGMGLVYTARQTSIDRTIAVKMMKPHHSSSPEARVRFLSEAAVTGDLDHPNVVPIHELGKDETGQLFYAMKHVRGTEWCMVLPGNSQSENVEILLRVADAVAFAHSRDVIHRDIKPENVMLGDFGEVLLMDWGLAASVTGDGKAEPLVEGSSANGGTPAYMPPEMARADAAAIGFCSDVYLLGAVLYEIVAGKRPHTGSNTLECLANAARNVIQPADAEGELLDVGLKAMATAPADRFSTVKDFQNAVRGCQSHAESVALAGRARSELDRALAGSDYDCFARAQFGFREALERWPKNVVAKAGMESVSLAYAKCAHAKGDYELALSVLDTENPDHRKLASRVKQAHRQRERRVRQLRLLASLAVALVAVTMLQMAISYFSIRSEKERAVAAEREAVGNRMIAEKRSVELDKAAAELARRSDDVYWEACETSRVNGDPVRRLLLAIAARDSVEDHGLGSPRLWETHIADAFGACPRLAFPTPFYPRWQTLAFNPRGTELAAAGEGIIKVWDSASGRELVAFDAETERVSCLRFTPDGKQLASAGVDSTATFWRPGDGKRLDVIDLVMDDVCVIAFSPDGKTIAAAGSVGGVKVRQLEGSEQSRILKGHEGPVFGLRFSPDGSTLASLGGDGTARLWDADTGTEKAVVQIVEEGGLPSTGDLAFSPDGALLATVRAGPGEGRVRLWDAATGQDVCTLDTPITFSIGFRGVAFSPDGRLLVSSYSRRGLAIWDLATRRYQTVWLGDCTATNFGRWTPRSGMDICFSRDGQMVALLDEVCSTIWLCDANAQCEFAYVPTRRFKPWHLCFAAPRVRSDAVGSARPAGAASDSPEPCGTAVALMNVHHEVCFLDLGDGQVTRAPGAAERDISVDLLCHSDGEGVVEVGHTGGEYVVRNTGTGETLTSWSRASPQGVSLTAGRPFDVSRDGRLMATGSGESHILLWGRGKPEPVVLKNQHGETRGAKFSPDGTRLAAVHASHRASLWDTATGELLWLSDRGNRRVCGPAFSPDGGFFAYGQGDSVALYDLARKEASVLSSAHNRDIKDLAFSPCGRLLASVARDHTTLVWDTESGRRQSVLKAHQQWPERVAFGADGSVLVWTALDGTVKVWEMPTSDTSEYILEEAAASSIAFSPDGTVLCTGHPNGGLLLWDTATRRKIAERPEHDAQVRSLCFSPDGSTLASASSDGCIRLWDLEEGGSTLVASDGGFPLGLDYSRDGETLAWAQPGGRSATVTVWDVEAREVLTRLEVDPPPAHGRHVFALSPDGETFVSAGPRRVQAYRVGDGKLLSSYGRPDATITAVAYAPDADTVALGCGDGVVLVWNPLTSDAPVAVGRHEARIWDLAFSFDGQILVSKGSDWAVTVWDLGGLDKPCVSTFSFEAVGVNELAVSPGPRTMLAVASGKGVTLRYLRGERIDAQLAARTTGCNLEGLQVKPLSRTTYLPRQDLMPCDGFAFAGKRPAESVPNPHLSPSWSEEHPNHWIPGARRGEAKALYHLATIHERRRRDADARRLHEQAATKEGAGQDEWAEKSRQRLARMPWLQPQTTSTASAATRERDLAAAVDRVHAALAEGDCASLLAAQKELERLDSELCRETAERVASTLMDEAWDAHRRGAADMAERLFRCVLSLRSFLEGVEDPVPYAYHSLGVVLRAKGVFGEALACLKQGARLGKTVSWYSEGRLLERQDELGRAATAYRMFLDLSSKATGPPNLRYCHYASLHGAQLYARLGRLDESVEMLEAWARRSPKSTSTRNVLACAYVAAGRSDAAHGLLGESPPGTSTSREELLLRMSLAPLDGDRKGASEIFAVLADKDGWTPRDQTIDAVANMLFYGVDLTSALTFQEGPTPRLSRYASGILGGGYAICAEVHARAGDEKQTQVACGTALRHSADTPQVQARVGNAYVLLGKPDRALPYLERAVMLRGDDPAYFDALGVCLYRLGRHDDALRVFEQSLELDRDNASAHAHRGLVNIAQGNLATAMPAYARVAELQPRRLYTLAIAELCELLQPDQPRPEAHFALAFLYEQQDDRFGARKHYLAYLGAVSKGAFALRAQERLVELNPAAAMGK